MLCFFFVNDIAVLFDRQNTEKVDEFQKKLFARYKMRYFDKIEWFLDIKIIKNRHHRLLYLCQNSYINKFAMKFKIDLIKKSFNSFLMKNYIKNAETIIKQKIYAYQQRVKFINYAAIIICFDVTYVVFKLSEFLINSSKKHFDASNRIFFYLTAIKFFSIRFNAKVSDSQFIFFVSSDTLYADDFEIRYNFQNYEFKLFDDLVNWKTFKQKTVIISSTETELLAISTTKKKLIWWIRFFDEISFQLFHTSIIQCDNAQTIRVFLNSTSTYIIKLKYVDVHKHWLSQKIKNRKINVR